MRVTACIIFCCLLFACKKETFTTDPGKSLRITADTLHFDTVFTTTSSVTQVFKIINDNNEGIHISSVQLKGGVSSPFKINVNGQPGYQFNNLDVVANDSAYVFVSVKINPSSANLPFIVRDSIEVSYNGKKEMVQLQAYGKNAHFLRNHLITTNETWNNDLPYVILGALEIAPDASLTINKGCQIFLHADAPIIVRGSLKAEGESDSAKRIVFNGDRLDEPYKDFPASWPGIYFLSSSKDNLLKYAILKNAYQAVVVQGPRMNANPKLKFQNSIIDNAYDIGLLGVNTSITAENLLISNSGKNLVLVDGGDYLFTHCTVASFGTRFITHKHPVLLLSNYLESQAVTNSLIANFTNCIFWGEGGLADKEVSIVKAGSSVFDVRFNNVLWKIKDIPAEVKVTDPINNKSPEFISTNTAENLFNFKLSGSSPAVDAGSVTNVPLDIDGKPRVNKPDLGCYEKQ